MKKFNFLFSLFMFLMLCVGQMWGENATYQHVFTSKPSTGNNIVLSNVSWSISAENLGSYNGTNYAGVQLGTSSKNGSITLTSSSAWGSDSYYATYKGKTKVTEVRLWLNLGGTSVTPSVTIGGKSATSDGTKVVKNSSAVKDWTQATKVTFTPAADGNTGVVVINVTTVKAGYICAIEIDCEEPSANETCAAPTFSVAAGAVLSGTKVSLSTTTDGATIYYNMGANPSTPTTSSSVYSTPIEITSATTIKAIAVKDGMDNSSVASASYTIATPLTTMDEIFAAATKVGSLATDYFITFSNDWVVTGVSTNGKYAYLSDGTKGLILNNTNGNMGLLAGKTLSGTIKCALVLYNGSAELASFTTAGLTIGDGTLPAVQELDASGVSNLTAANTGSLIKISGTCTSSNNKYYIGDVQLYNTLYVFSTPTENANYTCTGVYIQYNSTKEIAPRSAEDLSMQTAKASANTYWNGAISGSLSIRANEIVENLWSTASSGTKSFSSSDESVATIANNGDITIVGAGSTTLTFTTDANDSYYAGTATLTLTVKAALPAGAEEFEWAASTLGESDVEITTVTANNSPIKITYAKETASNAPKYYKSDHTARLYTNGSLTISAETEGKLIAEIVFDSNFSLTANKGTYNNGTWSGLAREVIFTATATCKISTISILYADGTVTTLSIDNITLQTTDEPFTINPSCNVTPMPAIVYSNYNSDYITIDDGKITPKAEGTTTVTASIAQGSNYSAVSTSFTVAVADKEIPALSFEQETYTAALGTTFTAPELTNPKKVAVEYSSSETSVAAVDAQTGAIILVGEGESVITAAFAGNETYAKNSATYNLVVKDATKDYFTADNIGVPSTQYSNWEKNVFGSGIVYVGNTALNNTDIQMRSDNNNSGIVSKTTIGYVKSVEIASLTADRSLDIYGSNVAYSDPSDLYGDNKGTLLGTLTSSSKSIIVTGNYKYVGIRSRSKALQIGDITIKWTPVTFAKYSVTYQAGEATGNDVVVSNIDEGTTIKLADKPEGFTYDADHVFAGWKLNGEGEVLQAGSDYEVNEDATFVAQWSAAYTITYKAGEGSGSNVVVNNVPAGAYELAECTFTAPEGKQFAGWKLNGEGEALADGSTYNVAGSVEFVAQWITANVVTFVAGTDMSDSSPIKKSGISITANTFNDSRYYQCYSGSSMTIVSEVGNIIKIEITTKEKDGSKYNAEYFSAEGYSAETNSTTGTWVGDAAEVELAASAQVRMTQIVVTYVPNGNVPKQEAGLVYTPDQFTITVGDAFETPRLTNPYDVPVTYSGNNSKLATVNASNGALTLVEGAAGQITVTATFEGNDLYYAGSASYTLVVNEPADNVSGSWKRTAAVEDGMRIIIAEYSTGSATMGKDNGNNRAAVSSSVSDNVLTPGFGTNVFTLIAQGDDKYAIRASNGNYLYAASSSNNYLKEKAVLDDNCKWIISISDGKATITAQGGSTHNVIRYNSSNSLFSCYESGKQSDIAIYSKKAKMENDANASEFDDHADLKVSADKTLTVTATKQLGEVRLEDGAIINTDDANASLTVENFYFKTTNGKSNQFTDPTKFNVTGDFFYDVKLYNTANEIDADYWYSIAVPFDVDINNGIYNADGKKLTNGTDYEVWGYDTEKRAQTMSNGWKRISGKMQAGHAYLIGFNSGMTSTVRLKAANTWKTSLFSASSMSMTAASNDADDQGRHSNWNGVANPTLHYIGINQDVQVFDNDGHSFSTFASDTYDFVVGTAFFVQGTADVAIQDADHGSLRAPAREGNKYVYSVRITRGDKAKFDNQIVIRASEDASNTYEQGHDMMTMNNATAPTALLWTENYGGTRLAVEEAPIVNNSASYVLGIYAPADDEYTLSVAEEMSNVSLYLTRNGSIIWDLSASPITLTLNKGTNTGYGLIMQARAPQVVTGTENVENSLNAQKILFNEHVYILRDGQLYDVTGKLAK